MCGIAGIVDFAARPIDRTRVEKARILLKHRGPDDDDVWYDENDSISVGLTATRLAILDTTTAGRQPMSFDNGRYVLVYNGLVYNFRDIAEFFNDDLRHTNVSCDSTVVLTALARRGPEVMNQFNGMWALAFYDRFERKGFLARDPYGIKPLVYAKHENRLTFASEMNALRTMDDWPGDIDPGALNLFLNFGYVLHPQTIYQRVRRLPPGHLLTFNADGVADPVRYHVQNRRVNSDASLQESARDVRRSIFCSVAKRRVSDVPLGAFLSGGLDSAIVVAHLAQLSSRPVKTFSVGWRDERAYDETAYARLVANRFGTDHYELKCRHADVLDILPAMLDHLGEPFFDSSILPTAIVSEFARRHVTVCLSGDASDELFGGYWRYAAHALFERLVGKPGSLRSGMLRKLSRLGKSGKSGVLRNRTRQLRKLLRADSPDPLARHIAWSRIIAPDAAKALIAGDESGDSAVLVEILGRAAQSTHADVKDPLNRIFAFDLEHSLPCDMLHKVDLASMYHSLEVRIPFLDPDVVETATALPSRFKLCRGQGKVILKHAYRNLLPDEILERDKMGFEVPVGEFFRGPLREMFNDTVSRSVVESFGFINYDAVRRVYNDHCARKEDHADILFALLSLCWWQARRTG